MELKRLGGTEETQSPIDYARGVAERDIIHLFSDSR